MTTLFRVAPLLFALFFQAAPTEQGWTSLFNGKDFTGWKVVNPASWTVKDGAIVAQRHRRPRVLRRPLQEPHVPQLRAEGGRDGARELERRRLRPDRVPGHGLPARRASRSRSTTRTHGSRARRAASTTCRTSTKPPAKDDEWFTEHIIVKGNTITVKVNDKQVVDWTQPADWNGGREGPGRAIRRRRHDRAAGARSEQHRLLQEHPHQTAGLTADGRGGVPARLPSSAGRYSRSARRISLYLANAARGCSSPSADAPGTAAERVRRTSAGRSSARTAGSA